MGDWNSQENQWSNYNYNYNQQDWGQGQQTDWTQGQGGGQSQDFQQFDYGNYGQQADNQAYGEPAKEQANPYLQMSSADSAYTGSMFIPDSGPTFSQPAGTEGTGFEDEPPLLEELGINPDHITRKTLTVLNPLMSTDAAVAGDGDLSGPIVFVLAFGSFVMFSGKLYFNYIYGVGVLGCMFMHLLLNLMSLQGVNFTTVVSVLGYCLLPMVGLSGISILFSLSGVVGNILAFAAVLWCTVSASKLFVTALEMKQQQYLVAYPCSLLYGGFALMTMF